MLLASSVACNNLGDLASVYNTGFVVNTRGASGEMDLPEKGKAAWRKGNEKWCKSHVDSLAQSKEGMKRIFDVEEINLLTCISSLTLLNLCNHVAAAAAACAAFKLPTTANAMTGETEYEICTCKSAHHVFAAPINNVLTINNFAIPNFSSSPAPFTSASAVNFSAGGPVGINIRQNHNSGSSNTQEVRVASR